MVTVKVRSATADSDSLFSRTSGARRQSSRTWRQEELYSSLVSSPAYSPSNGFRFLDDVVEYVLARTIRRPPNAGAVLRI